MKRKIVEENEERRAAKGWWGIFYTTPSVSNAGKAQQEMFIVTFDPYRESKEVYAM